MKKGHEKSEPWINLHGEFVDGKFTYYEFIEDEDGEFIKDQKYSFRFTDEKYHQHKALIITPKILKILVNETKLSDHELKKYISTVYFKEENRTVRDYLNRKARERRQRGSENG